MDIERIVREITSEVLKEVQGHTSGTSVSRSGMDRSYAKYMDHTVLKPDTVKSTVKRFCDEAREWQFASVCVNPTHVKYVAEQLRGSGVKTCCVIGFPLGATMPEVKAYETEAAINAGAKEVDMVINIGAAKSGEWDLVQKDIEAVVRASRGRALVKVIIETCLLSDTEKVAACKAAAAAGADFVKTSTGFSKHGATVADVRLMRQTVGPNMGVKASGGVRDLKSALAMINAGANRLGASSGVAVARELQGDSAPSECVGCGNCSSTCPVGRVDIIKSDY